jgi:uncharacterized RDD family membrane protein YckC
MTSLHSSSLAGLEVIIRIDDLVALLRRRCDVVMSLLKRLAEAEANASSAASASPASTPIVAPTPTVDSTVVEPSVELPVVGEPPPPRPPEIDAPRPTVTSLAPPLELVPLEAESSGEDGVAASSVRPIGTAIRIDPDDPANVKRSKEVANWWLPEDVHSWWEIPEPELGEPTKDKPLTVEELMRREREFHLFGRGVGGKHVPDHSARLLAFVVDIAVHAAVGFLGYRGMLSAYPDRFTRYEVIGVVAGGAWLLLTLIPLLLWRATPGKLLLGLRVVRVNGDEVSAVRAAMRGFLPVFAPLLPIDCLTILSSPHRRRLGDYLLGTRVVSNG